jgi:hypothetical protein
VEVVMERQKQWCALAAMAAALASACSLEQSGKAKCNQARDCVDGYMCTADKVCVPATVDAPPGAPDAPANPADGPTEPADAPMADAPTSSGGVDGHRLVAVGMPHLPNEASAAGTDVDGNGSVDNAWQHPLKFLSNLGWYAQGAIDDRIDAEELVILSELRTSGDSATVAFRLGRRQGSTDTFEAVPGAAPIGELTGTLDGRRLAVGPGRLSVPLSALTGLRATERVELVNARLLVADIAATTDGRKAWTGGRLGGAIASDALRTQLAAVVAAHAQESVTIDCPTASTCCRDSERTNGALLIATFDTDGDCRISAAEVAASADFITKTAPDLDLVGADGTRDSTSVGIGFGSTPAHLAASLTSLAEDTP